MTDRPKITRIAITFEVNGQSVTKEIEPSEVEALFFTDHSVREILAPFYDPKHPSPLRSTKNSPDGVLKHWTTPLTAGHLPVVMLKAPACSETPWG